jgi:hypothetical protein
MRILKPHNLANYRLSQLFGVAQGPPAMLHHPFIPMPVKTLPPLISGLGADPVFLAQLPKVAGMNRFQYKLFSLVHRFYFFPWHPSDYPNLHANCYPCSEPFVLPMY